MAEDPIAAGTGGLEQSEYVRMRIPSQFVHPYEMTDRNGKTWQKGIVNILPGARVNNMPLDGYSFDVFLRDFHLADIAAGQQTTISLRRDRDVEVFKKVDDARISFPVNPLALAHANKVARETFEDARAAERAQKTPAREEAAPQCDTSTLDSLEAECTQTAAGGSPSVPGMLYEEDIPF